MKHTLNNSPYLPGYDDWKLNDDSSESSPYEDCHHDLKFLGHVDDCLFHKCKICGQEIEQ